MPWSVETPMSQRREFIEDAERGLYAMRELCARCGICRRIGYKWLTRYREWGLACLVDQSRRPQHSPTQLDGELAALCVDARRRHPTWGPRKLLAYLERRHRRQHWCAQPKQAVSSTIREESYPCPRSRVLPMSSVCTLVTSNKPLQQPKPRDILCALRHHACSFAAERQGREPDASRAHDSELSVVSNGARSEQYRRPRLVPVRDIFYNHCRPRLDCHVGDPCHEPVHPRRDRGTSGTRAAAVRVHGLSDRAGYRHRQRHWYCRQRVRSDHADDGQ
jgi:hypothetical protein